MDAANASNSIQHLVAEALDCPAKEFGGDFKTIGDLGSPRKFLYWQFPDWKTNNKTVMVPPAYTPSEQGYTSSKDGKYGPEDNVNIRGMQGEKLVYNRLQEVGGAKNMGMFVIHGFDLRNICKWNDRCKSEDPEGVVPQYKLPKTGESDFIIFHHMKGVILLEVKNLKESDVEILESADLNTKNTEGVFQKSKDKLPVSEDEDESQIADQELAHLKEMSEIFSDTVSCSNERREENPALNVQMSETLHIGASCTVEGNKQEDERSFKKNAEIKKAKHQLDISRKVVEAFAVVAKSSTEQSDVLEPLPITMLTALPSTRRHTPHVHIDDTSFIYEEDLASSETFSKWWNDNIETQPSMSTTLETTRAYEIALSRMLAVRHLGPVTEAEYTAYTSYNLENFKHLENLASGRFRRIKEVESPHLFRWCKHMSEVNFPVSKVLKKEVFDTLKTVSVTATEANLIKVLNNHLSKTKFLQGNEPAGEDRKVFQYLWTVYIIDINSIARFMNRVAEAKKGQEKIKEQTTTLKNLGLDKTDDVRRLNELSRLLDKSQSGFLEGECCTKLDVELCDNLAKGDIMTLPLTGKRLWAPVFTMEQLAVFEGPKKQLIIGGPGSGKTELMKAKALTLGQNSEVGQRILYLIQHSTKAIFPHVMKKFFKENKAKNVDVVTAEFKGEHYKAWDVGLERYSHVFIDELWIGSKIRYEMQEDGKVDVIDELTIAKQALENVKGYVWISSVFDFKEECFQQISDKEIRDVLTLRRLQGKGDLLYRKIGTPSLLKALETNGGVICRIKHLLRSVNNIVKLLQDYSALYLERDFPYGVKNMLNHNVDGQDISWIAVQPESTDDSSKTKAQGEHHPQVQLDELTMLMYDKCVEVIQQAICFNPSLRPSSLMKPWKSQVKLRLHCEDILVVNFVARYHESKNSLDKYLTSKRIPVFDLNEQISFSGGEGLDTSQGGVHLLNSRSRDDSACLDGAEWPMVIVLLTPELLLSDGNARFEAVRNYDPYIAMFRAQAKLVVISDSWRSSQDFLDSVGKKPR